MDDGNIIVMVEPDEAQEQFMMRFIALLQETKELGPIIHTAILGQVVGKICATNQSWPLDEAMKTVIMNIHHGFMNTLHDIMEQSAESSIN